ncbi:radical SAM protein [bacterium]|nr:radical SAM protein [bacterium]
MLFCSQPFNRIEIYENGDVYNCCPPFVKYYTIGNIFNTPFQEIWNGEKVRELRRKIANSDFSFCDDICNRKNKEDEIKPEFKEYVDKYPEEISVSSDNSCNVKCKICRDEYYKTPYNKEHLEEEIDNIWLPIFKDAKLLRFGCSGEPFASYKETMIIKKAAIKYPNLKFHFHTNGILGNEDKLKELGVFERIDTITLSLHCASRWTYHKIIRGGKYDKVMKNIKLYSEMKQKGLLQHFRMIFVVYSENYKEMPNFVKLAKKNNAIAEFWALRKTDNTELGNNFDKYSLLNENNKYHKDLIKLLNKPIFQDESVILYPELKELITKK